MANREQIIIQTSLIGIIVNLILVGLKISIGLLSHSIAVFLDGINNLSDALSSVITIIGTKLAGKHPDKKHPLGYGRTEYITAMLIASIVLYAGITSFSESFQSILHTRRAVYSGLTLAIILIGVLTKLVLGIYVKRKGADIRSDSLLASGSDSLFDALLSLSVLASAVIYLFFHLSVEAYVGLAISVIILKSGLELLVKTLNELLGRRVDPALSAQIKDIILSDPAVMGVYDLFINNYGPEHNYASVHIEVEETMTASDIDRLSRKLQELVFSRTGMILTAIGIYSKNESGTVQANIHKKIQTAVLSNDWALQMHGFYVDLNRKELRFDVVISFDITPEEARRLLHQQIEALYPDYQINIITDIDISD